MTKQNDSPPHTTTKQFIHETAQTLDGWTIGMEISNMPVSGAENLVPKLLGALVARIQTLEKRLDERGILA